MCITGKRSTVCHNKVGPAEYTQHRREPTEETKIEYSCTKSDLPGHGS